MPNNRPFNSKFAARFSQSGTWATGKGSLFGKLSTVFHRAVSKPPFASGSRPDFSDRHPLPFLPAVPRKGD